MPKSRKESDKGILTTQIKVDSFWNFHLYIISKIGNGEDWVYTAQRERERESRGGNRWIWGNSEQYPNRRNHVALKVGDGCPQIHWIFSHVQWIPSLSLFLCFLKLSFFFLLKVYFLSSSQNCNIIHHFCLPLISILYMLLSIRVPNCISLQKQQDLFSTLGLPPFPFFDSLPLFSP